MTVVFADTSFYVASFFAKDQCHVQAVSFLKSFTGRIVTTEYVLVEASNFFSAPRYRVGWYAYLEQLKTSSFSVVVPSTTNWFERGSVLYGSRPDKEWSLTDCISFEVMKREGITHALTGDKHFIQAGFTVEFY